MNSGGLLIGLTSFISLLVNLVCKKLKKRLSAPEIADMLEEKGSLIQQICDIAVKYAPNYDVDRILKDMTK